MLDTMEVDEMLSGSNRKRFSRDVGLLTEGGTEKASPSLRSLPFGSTSSRPLRVALYSPGMVGLGHMRRSLLLARTLVDSHLRITALLLAEGREANSFPMPSGVDCVSLPALRKDHSGDISPRYLRVPIEDVLRLRARTIRAVLESFAPDALIVDHLPRGAGGELDEALTILASRPGARCVLGLRDVLDEPEIVRREWRRWENEKSIRAHYDAIWIYGDPAVYDPVTAYRFPPDIAAKVRFTGYLDHRARIQSTHDARSRLGLAGRRLSLCLLGGGQDGAPLGEAFLEATLPSGSAGIVLAGPYMPASDRERLHELAVGRPHVQVLDFLDEPTHLLSCADRVVAMGGYNTTWEILSFGKRALVVPRVRPGREQWIRAKRLEELGLVDVLEPEAATPAALTAWLADDRGAPGRRAIANQVHFDGWKRVPSLLQELLGARAVEKARPQYEYAQCHAV